MDALAAVEKAVIGVLLLFEVALTAGNVLSRYVLHKGWSFTEEIVVAVLVLMSLMGAALCAREKHGLVSLTLLTDLMPKKAQLIIDILMILLSMTFAAAMIRFGIQRCLMQVATNRTTSVLQLPEWYYSSFVPIGGALLFLHLIERIVDDVCALISDKTSGEGSAT
jgi:TRAP-type C4-dicarboxylate transport system permease small subunit